MYISLSIYIYIERERDIHICVYIYIYIHNYSIASLLELHHGEDAVVVRVVPFIGCYIILYHIIAIVHYSICYLVSLNITVCYITV